MYQVYSFCFQNVLLADFGDFVLGTTLRAAKSILSHLDHWLRNAWWSQNIFQQSPHRILAGYSQHQNCQNKIYLYLLHFISFHFFKVGRYSRDIFLDLNFQYGSKTVIFQTFSASRFCIISQCNACLICATLAISAWNGSVHLSSQFQNTITTYLSISFSSQCRKIRDSKCTWFWWWKYIHMEKRLNCVIILHPFQLY